MVIHVHSRVSRKQRQVSLRVRVDQQKVLRKVLRTELMEMCSRARWQKQRKVFKKAHKKVCRKRRQAACQRALQNPSRFKSRKAFKYQRVSRNQLRTQWAHQRPSNHRARKWVHRASRSRAVSKSLARASSQLSSKRKMSTVISFPLFLSLLSEKILNLFERRKKTEKNRFVKNYLCNIQLSKN